MSRFKIRKHKLLIQRQSDNSIVIDKSSLFFLNWLILLTSFSYLLNCFYLKFQGTPYVQEHAMFTIISYACLNLYICHLIPQLNRLKRFFGDLLLLGLLLLSVQIFTNGIQFTPFHPIDHYIYQIEPLPLEQLVSWTHLHPKLTHFLEQIYESLSPALFGLPFLFLIISPQEKFHNWIKFFLITTCIGFTFYYLFPSCGPASIFQDLSIFKQYQLDNFVKFQQIHQGISPTTHDGGLIALPSFHVIWAWTINRLFKNTYTLLFVFTNIWFIGVCCACVLLGWHYSIDILASLGIIYVAEKHLKN